MTGMRSKALARARIWGAATAVVGATAMLRAHHMAGAVSGGGTVPDAAVVRFLGGRQLLQGTAVLIRPDGHVAWVGDGVDGGLRDALTTWCGEAQLGSSSTVMSRGAK